MLKLKEDDALRVLFLLGMASAVLEERVFSGNRDNTWRSNEGHKHFQSPLDAIQWSLDFKMKVARAFSK